METIIQLNKIGTELSTRTLAQKAKQDINVSQTERLIFDFSGITFATQSFIDELIGMLLVKLGKQKFLETVNIRNAVPEILTIIRVVLQSRQELLSRK